MRVSNALKLIAFKGAPFLPSIYFPLWSQEIVIAFVRYDTDRASIYMRTNPFPTKIFSKSFKTTTTTTVERKRTEKKDTRMCCEEKVQWFNGIRNHHESAMIAYSNDFSKGIELIEKQSHQRLCANNSISVDLQIDTAWEWLSWVWLSWVKGDFWWSIYSCSKYGKRRMQTTFP